MRNYRVTWMLWDGPYTVIIPADSRQDAMDVMTAFFLKPDYIEEIIPVDNLKEIIESMRVGEDACEEDIEEEDTDADD